jgi:hypothetical protein
METLAWGKHGGLRRAGGAPGELQHGHPDTAVEVTLGQGRIVSQEFDDRPP